MQTSEKLRNHSTPKIANKKSILKRIFLFTHVTCLLQFSTLWQQPHEKNRGYHQTIQAGRCEISPLGAGRRRDDRLGGEGFWPAKGPYGNLSRQRIYRGFPAQDQTGDR